MILKNGLKTLKKVFIMKKLLFKSMEPVIIIYQQEKKLKLDFILLIRLQKIL